MRRKEVASARAERRPLVASLALVERRTCRISPSRSSRAQARKGAESVKEVRRTEVDVEVEVEVEVVVVREVPLQDGPAAVETLPSLA